MSSWHLLKKIVGKPSKSSLARDYTYDSERFRTIRGQLNPTNTTTDEYNNGTRANLYSHKALNPDARTLMFLAHHDVVHPEFANVLDNTASVSNLIELGKQLENEELNINVVIAFSDGEELASHSSSGSVFIAKKIVAGDFGDVIEVVNLELTAMGNIMWVSGNGPLIEYANNTTYLDTPFSDTAVLIRHEIPSTCIGTFSLEDLREVQKHGTCKTWELCHEVNDTMDLAVEEDMDRLVGILKEYTLAVSNKEPVDNKNKLGLF